ncbi:MAG: colanic acid biosynthesis glycosyltransferase WcaL [Deltaproteobacteria bacterium]|nr:MAG: colanic acid biosynthesis glycosyltransferase WcaL [Deltaproteobacteria bacterium]
MGLPRHQRAHRRARSPDDRRDRRPDRRDAAPVPTRRPGQPGPGRGRRPGRGVPRPGGPHLAPAGRRGAGGRGTHRGRPVKVLYLLRYYPTLTETFVYREIAALAGLGVEVAIAALGRRRDGRLQTERPAVPAWWIPRRPGLWPRAPRTAGERWLVAHRGPRAAARLARLRRHAAGFDRVHVHFAGGAAEYARALQLDTDLPYSVTVHAVDLFKPRPALPEVLAQADRVVTVADHHRRLLAERGVTAAVVRCGPELSTWAALPPPPGGPLRALAVGRAVPKKGLDLLVRAWRHLDRPGARLTIISDLPDPGRPDIRCLGLRPPSEVAAAMAEANCVVLPCRRAPDGDMDGIPVALMEGLAAGRAVASTPVSGIPELVDDRVGWLAPPDDLDAWIALLRTIHDDPAERARRGARGPARLQERGFTATAQASGLLRLWQGAPPATQR